MSAGKSGIAGLLKNHTMDSRFRGNDGWQRAAPFFLLTTTNFRTQKIRHTRENGYPFKSFISRWYFFNSPPDTIFMKLTLQLFLYMTTLITQHPHIPSFPRKRESIWRIMLQHL
jgi:hypothetical protein